MANQIFVSVEDGMNEPEWISQIDPFVQKVLSELGYDGEEISIMFCSDKMIQELNGSYRNIDSPTDVLSFENGEDYTDEEGNEIDIEVPVESGAYFTVTEEGKDPETIGIPVPGSTSECFLRSF